jgi:hypothetical protein
MTYHMHVQLMLKRNLISDNIFANILRQRHPKKDQYFKIPKHTIIIKGYFQNWKTDVPKSSMYHKLVQSRCGDDKVQCGNGTNVIRIDPCLKLFIGCPIMVNSNDFKNLGAVKGTTAKFMGLKLKSDCEMNVELWNGYKVYTVQANEVEYILCEHSKKEKTDSSRTFMLPPQVFPVTVNYPIGSRECLKLEKSKIIQFPINNDLATTGHKLQGMTKKYLIVSSLNYSTPNWIYVVFSRVTSLDGLFLMQPLMTNYNPQPTKLLKQEWIFQKEIELATLEHLKKFGNFPVEIDLLSFCSFMAGTFLLKLIY